jgi:hypothetical protein
MKRLLSDNRTPLRSPRITMVVVAVLAAVTGAFGGTCQAVEHDLEQWNTVTLEAPITERTRLILEAQPRIADNVRRFDQLILRGGVGRILVPQRGRRPEVTVWQGYAWTPSFQPRFSDEHRLWQQVQLRHKLGKRLSLDHRTRLEQQFFRDHDPVTFRLRHRLQGVYALGREKKWSLVASNEAFVNLNNAEPDNPSGFDQNRLFVGVRRKVSKTANLEVGYTWLVVNRSSPSEDTTSHIMTVNLRFGL